ncbi:hypothetical protein GQ457_13G017740 [Hibiscus cannabinus]
MSEGSPLGAHVIKLMGYIKTLVKLGFALNDELAIDVFLQSLSGRFNQFVLNFNMNEINKTLPQLLGMLRTVEGNMKKGGSKSILMVREAKGKGKKVAKSKDIGKTKPKGKEALKPKGGVSIDGKCFHCGKTGHWKSNCPIDLEDVKKPKAVGASVSGIYVIDVNMSTSSSWVLDIGCGSHICTSVQGLHTRRNLAKGDVDLVGGYALETAAFTLNRVPSKSVQKTPHGIWTGRRPNMSFMMVWGCKAYVKHQMSTKLEPKSQKCTFVGYPKETKGYYFYNENKVLVARTGVFLEKEFLSNKGKGINIELEELQQQQVHEPEVEETPQVVEENLTDLETQPLRRSTRELHEPERYGFLITTHGDVILVDQDEPTTYQEAVSSPDSEKWLQAMRSEMDSMSETKVWTLVEPTEGIKPIGCKWFFKKKTDMDGNVQTYKEQLVAKRFSKNSLCRL